MKCHFKELLRVVDDTNMEGALKQFEYHIRSKNLTPKTISGYGERLGYFRRFLRSKQIAFDQVTRFTIQDFILHQQGRGLASISINGQLKVLKIFLKYLAEEGFIATDPAAKVSLLKTEKKLKVILTEEQVEALLAVPKRATFTGMRNFLMVLVFYDTLIRLSELINLRMTDVDLDGGTLRIYGKGRKVRIVPMGMKTVKHLHKFFLRHRNGTDSQFVFTTRKGHPLDPRNVLRILERIGNRARVHVSPHLLRHSAASHRALCGMPAFLLQRLLGHSTIQMTERYVHLVDDEKMKAAFRQFSPTDLMRV